MKRYKKILVIILLIIIAITLLAGCRPYTGFDSPHEMRGAVGRMFQEFFIFTGIIILLIFIRSWRKSAKQAKIKQETFRQRCIELGFDPSLAGYCRDCREPTENIHLIRCPLHEEEYLKKQEEKRQKEEKERLEREKEREEREEKERLRREERARKPYNCEYCFIPIEKEGICKSCYKKRKDKSINLIKNSFSQEQFDRYMQYEKEKNNGTYVLYTLALEGGNYYVGVTDDFITRLGKHLIKDGAEWTKLHKPVKVISLHLLTGITIHKHAENYEDAYTVEMMNKYGTLNVRGGHFVVTTSNKNMLVKKFTQYNYSVQNNGRVIPTSNNSEHNYLISQLANTPVIQ